MLVLPIREMFTNVDLVYSLNALLSFEGHVLLSSFLVYQNPLVASLA